MHTRLAIFLLALGAAVALGAWLVAGDGGSVAGDSRSVNAASSSDPQLDFIAAEPSSYDHTSGVEVSPGSLQYDSRIINVYVVEQLEGTEFTCGDRLVFFTRVTTPGALTPAPLFLQYGFDAKNRLDPRIVGYRAVEAVGISGVDFAGQSTEEGNSGSGATAILVREELDGIFGADAERLSATVGVLGLGASESVIVRVDVKMDCFSSGTAGGSLGAGLEGAFFDIDGDLSTTEDQQDVVDVGNQVVPMIGFGELPGPTPTPTPTPTPAPTPTPTPIPTPTATPTPTPIPCGGVSVDNDPALSGGVVSGRIPNMSTGEVCIGQLVAQNETALWATVDRTEDIGVEWDLAGGNWNVFGSLQAIPPDASLTYNATFASGNHQWAKFYMNTFTTEASVMNAAWYVVLDFIPKGKLAGIAATEYSAFLNALVRMPEMREFGEVVAECGSQKLSFPLNLISGPVFVNCVRSNGGLGHLTQSLLTEQDEWLELLNGLGLEAYPRTLSKLGRGNALGVRALYKLVMALHDSIVEDPAGGVQFTSHP